MNGQDERFPEGVTELADVEARALLSRLPTPGPVAEARVAAKLRRSLARPTGPTPWALASLGATLGAVGVGVGVWFGLAAGEPEAVPVSLALDAAHDFRAEAIGEDVRLSFRGTGEVEGDSRAPRIRWERGVVNVDVVPGRGIDLRVETREATVRVVGTGFSVERDALGTAVEVRHGRVEVLCAGEAARFVDAGGRASCLPTSAGGMLGRARALETAGDPTVLGAVERGIALAGADEGAVRGELEVMRVHHLLLAGRRDDAIAAGETYLAGPAPTRPLEVGRMVGAARLEAGGCAAALPTLERTAALAGADAEDLAARDACRATLSGR